MYKNRRWVSGAGQYFLWLTRILYRTLFFDF